MLRSPIAIKPSEAFQTATRSDGALYATRIADLGSGDFASIRCIARGHNELIPPSSLIHGLRLPPTSLCSILNHGCAAASAMCAAKLSCRSVGRRVSGKLKQPCQYCPCATQLGSVRRLVPDTTD
jgi:hypothetical protein